MSETNSLLSRYLIRENTLNNIKTAIQGVINQENITLTEAIALLSNYNGQFFNNDLNSIYYLRILPFSTIISNGIIDIFYDSINQSATTIGQNIINIDISNISEIKSSTFRECTNLLTVNLPDTTIIESNAFRSCSNLTSISIPTIWKIGSAAFADCINLTDINFGDEQHGLASVTNFDENYYLSQGLFLYQQAFQNCGLVSISLSHVNLLMDNCFANCSKLETVYLSFVSYDDEVYHRINSTYQLGRFVFASCINLSYIEMHQVPLNTNIGYCFNGCRKLQTVNLDNSITTISSHMFYGAGDLSLGMNIIAPNCQFINQYAFEGAMINSLSLESLESNQVYYISPSAFQNANFVNTELTEVTQPWISKVGRGLVEDMFNGCNLTTVSLSRIEILESGCFRNCQELITINFPNTTGEVPNRNGTSCFRGCIKLSDINLPNLIVINSDMFYDCSSLESINLPNCRHIYSNVFTNCINLNSISLPKVESILPNAFNNCYNLISISLPCISYLSISAFYNCTSLTTINLRSYSNDGYDRYVTLNADASSIFYNCPIESIIVHKNQFYTYQHESSWAYYSDKFVSVD